jgi:hypothetical protein
VGLEKFDVVTIICVNKVVNIHFEATFVLAGHIEAEVCDDEMNVRLMWAGRLL